MQAISFTQTGGPDVLTVSTLEIPTQVGAGEILVKNFVVGVNFVDILFRNGFIPAQFPINLGMEGSGIVEKVGAGANFQVGEKVAYLGVGVHSYAGYTVVPANEVVKVPEGLSFEDAAAAMMQGITAHYLVEDTYKVKRGDWVLIHAGAGGVGQLLTQLAVSKGATVITTVSSEEKAAISKANGAHYTVNYSTQGWIKEVAKITNNVGVNVVYDSVGKSTFQGSLDSLRKRGHLVFCGFVSGVPDPIEPMSLGPKSISLTRPMITHYIEDPAEYQQRAKDVFQWLKEGTIRFTYTKFPLAQAKEAHEALENRKTTGKLLLVIEH